MTVQSKTVISPALATVLIAGLVSIMPFAIDAYLPALGAMALDLGTTVHHLERSVGSFFLGTAIGQLIGFLKLLDRLKGAAPHDAIHRPWLKATLC